MPTSIRAIPKTGIHFWVKRSLLLKRFIGPKTGIHFWVKRSKAQLKDMSWLHMPSSRRMAKRQMSQARRALKNLRQIGLFFLHIHARFSASFVLN